MNIPSFLPIAATGVSLLLSLWLFVVSNTNSSLQGDLQKKQTDLQKEQQELQMQVQQFQNQQQQINTGVRLAKEIGPTVLRELGNLAVQNKNDAIKKLLAKHGVNIQENPDAGKPAKPAPTPAP